MTYVEICHMSLNVWIYAFADVLVDCIALVVRLDI